MTSLWSSWSGNLPPHTRTRIFLPRSQQPGKESPLFHILTPYFFIPDVYFIVTFNMKALSHKKPISTGISPDRCGAQGHDKSRLFVLAFDLHLILPSNLLFSDFPTKNLYCLYMLPTPPSWLAFILSHNGNV